MSSSSTFILFIIILYLAAMILVGFFFSKKGSGDSSGEFFLGGRKLGPFVTAMSAEASDMSSYLLMGLPGLAYISGIAEVGWTIIGLAAGTYLNFLLVARRLRRYSAKVDAITIPDFFSRRFHDDRHLLSCLAAMVILIFFIPYTASGFKAVGTLFNSLFGWDYHIAMIIGAIVIIGYTTLGGFLAVSTTDLIQSVFMSIALIVIVFYGISQAGGVQAVIDNASALPGYLNLTKGYDMASGSAGSYDFLTILSTLAWGLGYFGMPHILLRFMAIRDEREVKTSRRIASVWVLISMLIAVLIGIIGYSVSVAGKIPMLTTSEESETVIIQMANAMSESGFFFAAVAGVIMAGILAATMSTADSQLLAAASSISHDMAENFLGIHLTPKKSALIARLTVIVIAVIGLILAWNPKNSVFRVVSFAWAGFGAAFGPVMLLSLYWKRANRQGAFAGMLAGGLTVFVWKFFIAPLGGVFAIYELLPGFLMGLTVMICVSLLTKAPEESILREFDSMKK